jgi:two-component system sensor histidine kinase BaeS
VVFGDKDRLMQLFNNLLENSLRYTDSGGGLHISGRQENGRFALTFADSAPGVQDAQLENCLNVFTVPKAPQPRQRRFRPGAGDLR